MSGVTQAVQMRDTALTAVHVGTSGTIGLAFTPMRLQFEYATSKVAAAANTAWRSGSPATVLRS